MPTKDEMQVQMDALQATLDGLRDKHESTKRQLKQQRDLSSTLAEKCAALEKDNASAIAAAQGKADAGRRIAARERLADAAGGAGDQDRTRVVGLLRHFIGPFARRSRPIRSLGSLAAAVMAAVGSLLPAARLYIKARHSPRLPPATATRNHHWPNPDRFPA